jgi:hypothetical protein
MILSDEDKTKFMRFLEEDIYSNEGIMRVLEEKQSVPAFDMLLKHKQSEVLACKVVHKMLASMTTERIG